MRQMITRGSVLLLVLFALGLVISPGVGVSSVRADDDDAHAEHDKLHDLMEELEDHYRQLRRQVRDASENADSAERVLAMQRMVIDARQETPDSVEQIADEQQRAAAMLSYRTRMIELHQQLLTLEAALISNDNAEAFEALKRVHAVRVRGHEDFRIDD